MEFKGIIVSGSREGSYFMSQKVYNDQFRHELGFKPFPGTLNIKIGGGDLDLINTIPPDKFQIIKGQGKFGDVKYLKASLKSQLDVALNADGALIFPLRTHHPPEILEFIASKNLRESLNLKEGDPVTLKLEI
jgi:riboflavin kinase